MDKDYLVTKSNHFIMNSSYDLSLEEQKIILTLASMVQPSDEEFKPYIFRIAEFMELVGVSDKSKYTEIPKITKELMKKVFEIQEGNTIIQTAWLSGTRYEKGSGMVTLKFNPDLKPYMLQLNSMFTQYKLANILSMKSKYSPRIYEVLKCNEFKKQGYIEIEVEELRKLLRADNVYPLYADFKRFVLLQTQKELKKLTDIDFEFQEIKTGRKVTTLRFIISSNVKQDQAKNERAATSMDQETDELEQENILYFIKEPITALEVRKILDTANGDIEIVKEKYSLAQKQGNIDNLVAWLINAIKDNYREPIKKRKVIPGESNKRQYDTGELERILLGRSKSDE